MIPSEEFREYRKGMVGGNDGQRPGTGLHRGYIDLFAM